TRSTWGASNPRYSAQGAASGRCTLVVSVRYTYPTETGTDPWSTIAWCQPVSASVTVAMYTPLRLVSSVSVSPLPLAIVSLPRGYSSSVSVKPLVYWISTGVLAITYVLSSTMAPTASTLSAASTASRKARPASSTAFFRAAHSRATASRWSLSVTIYSPPSTVLSPWGSDTRPALTARYKSDRLICASMEVLMDIPASTS